MGFNNPDVTWSELERVLSGKSGGSLTGGGVPVDGAGADGWDGPVPGDGGDSPAWSRKREPYQPPTGVPSRLRPPSDGSSWDDSSSDGPRLGGSSPDGCSLAGAVPYAELHCHSNFSFLDGASHPEALVEQAARLGLEAIALTDHDGMYGVVRFAEAAAQLGIGTIFGAELSLELPGPQNGVPDPVGTHLLALARGPEGYSALCRTISTAQLRGKQKGRPIYHLEEVAKDLAGHVVVLTGCRKGAVRRALAEHGKEAAGRELRRLVELFGSDGVVVELTDHGPPTETECNDALAELAHDAGLPVVATNGVHYATPDEYPLATALAAVRARRGLDDADGWLPVAGAAHLRSGAEMAARFEARYPGAVARAAA